jgi:hypothetical protein
LAYFTAARRCRALLASRRGPKHCARKQKTHRRAGHRGGLPALRFVVSLSRDFPTRRRTVAATTDAGAGLYSIAHGTLSIIQRGERKSIRGMVWRWDESDPRRYLGRNSIAARRTRHRGCLIVFGETFSFGGIPFVQQASDKFSGRKRAGTSDATARP